MRSEQEEISTSLSKGNQNPAIGPLSGIGFYSLFFVYEALLSIVSLFFISARLLLTPSSPQSVAISQPGLLFVSVILLAGFRLYLAYGLLNKSHTAWMLALGALTLGAIASASQVFGGLYSLGSIWVVVAQFETSGFLLAILGAFVSHPILSLACSLAMTGVYLWTFYKLYHSRHGVFTAI